MALGVIFDKNMNTYDHLVSFLERRGKLFIVGSVLLAIASLIGIILVKIETDFSVFMAAKSEQAERIDEVSDLFGDSDQMLVLVETSGEIQDIRALLQMTIEIETIESVVKAASAIPVLMLDKSDAEIAQSVEMIAEINNDAFLTARNDGGYWFTIRLFLESGADFPALIRKTEDLIEVHGRDYLLSGEPYLRGKIFDYILRVLLFLPPAAVILLLIVFRLRIGSIRATMLSMVPAVLGGVLTLGSLSWLKGSISIMTALIPIFIIVLGSADGLHVTSHVMDRLKEGKSNKRAIAETLEAVGIPIIMTSITTMAGFLSMLLIDSRAIREMGVGAAWGIALAGITTWIVLPVLLLHQKPLPIRPDRGRGMVLGFFKKLQGWPAIVLTLVIIAAAIPGALRLHSDFSMLTMYKKNTEVRKSIEKTTEILGGAIPVMLTYSSDGVFDSKAAKAILAFQREAEDQGLTANSMSIFRTVQGIVEYQTGKPLIPQNLLMQEMILKNINAINPGMIDQFYRQETGRAFFFLPNLDDDTLDGFLNLAAEISDRYGHTVQPVSSAFAMKEMNDQIIPQQMRSLILALGLVIVLSTLTQKSLGLGLLSGLPIGVTLIGLFGFMGYAGIELSVISGIMTGLTVGVGIDYAIHYVSLYRYQKRRLKGSPRETRAKAATQALEYVATPVLANAMGLAIGFTAMALSPFRIHVTLSLLMWVTMLLSAFLSLSLLPSILGFSTSSPEDSPQ